MKIILILLFIISFVKAKSQLVVAEDFSLTDVWGVQRNLYNELELGKTVVLNFFIVSCGTCQINIAKLDSLWQAYGLNGDSLWVWGIEASGKLDSEILEYMNQWNVTFPCFSSYNDDIVLYVYNITYTPQYFVVCPNKIMKQVAISQIESAIFGCKQTNNSDTFDEHDILWDNYTLTLKSNENFDIQVYDIFGRKIKELISAFNSVDMSDLNRGIYICKVKLKHLLFSKIIIKH